MESFIARPELMVNGFLSAALLIGLLVLRELAGEIDGQSRWRELPRLISVATVPLLIAFLISIGLVIAGALR